MARFETKIKRKRFEVTAFPPERMIAIGQRVIESEQRRIQAALTVDDTAARPLKEKYKLRKQRKGGKGIRDLTLTGMTLRSRKVISAENRRAVIGFTNAQAIIRARANNKRERQFGMSPMNRRDLIETVSAIDLITVKDA